MRVNLPNQSVGGVDSHSRSHRHRVASEISMFAELYNIANDARSRHPAQCKWNGAPAIETGIGRDVRGPASFAEAREVDLNDVRVPGSTMMDGPAYGQ